MLRGVYLQEQRGSHAGTWSPSHPFSRVHTLTRRSQPSKVTGVWRLGACLWSQRAETSHPCAPLWLLCSALAVPLISHISSRSDIRHILVTPLSDHSVSGPHLPTN